MSARTTGQERMGPGATVIKLMLLSVLAVVVAGLPSAVAHAEPGVRRPGVPAVPQG